MAVLVTGGAGFIGSHACVELLGAGYDVVVVDNLSNSSEESLERVKKITGRQLRFYKADLLDRAAMEDVFKECRITSVLHFAGLKAVGESVSVPLRYYHNNLTGTIILCMLMQNYGVKDIIFSSSATVYGDPDHVPITEDFPLKPVNPYGRTKYMIEQMLKDGAIADPSLNVMVLRYFNPVGAHASGLIGEDPKGMPNNLMPYIARVAAGKLEKVSVFGSDYPTADGTGVRDYIHVVDLAKGHVKALEKLEKLKTQKKPSKDRTGVFIYNLGTGSGCSVLEMIRAFSAACGKTIPYSIVGRRPGDIAECCTDPSKAFKELGWKAEKGIDEMCADAWRWQSANPDGYRKKQRMVAEE